MEHTIYVANLLIAEAASFLLSIPVHKMKLSHGLSYAFTSLLALGATAAPSHSSKKPAYFVLAGDSTTAVDGGWGDGFLETAVREPAAGINLGHSGATTVSFRDGGDWAAVIEQVRSHTKSHQVFVTIQVRSKLL